MLEKIDLGARSLIRIMLVEPDVQLRNSLRHVLFGAGFKNLQDCGSLKHLEADFETDPPDLLFIDAHTPGGDACDLVHRLRFSLSGRNPFLSVILTVWKDRASDIVRLINSGADHILVKPVSPQTIFERIEALLERRKPFVATSQYIGPDRRKDMRAETHVPHFEVPNSLRLKATSRHVDPVLLQKEIDQAMALINAEMLRRLAFHLACDAKRLAGEESGETDPAKQAAASMQGTTLELMRRLAGGSSDETYKTARKICDLLSKTDTQAPAAKNRDLLLNLAMAVNLGLKNAKSGEELMHEVNAALEKRRGKQAA